MSFLLSLFYTYKILTMLLKGRYILGTLARVGSVGTLASVKQGPPPNLPPYMLAHFADHMATANIYAVSI